MRVIGIGLLFLLWIKPVYAQWDWFSLEDYYQFLKKEKEREKEMRGRGGMKWDAYGCKVKGRDETFSSVGAFFLKPYSQERSFELEVGLGMIEYEKRYYWWGWEWTEYINITSIALGMRHNFSKEGYTSIMPAYYWLSSGRRSDNAFGIGFFGGLSIPLGKNAFIEGELGYRLVRKSLDVELTGFGIGGNISFRF